MKDSNLPTSNPETDQLIIRLIRQQMGKEWETARENIIQILPDGVDPRLLDKFVDYSDQPGIHLNAYGVEPRFYAHRNSKRLLEFYPSQKSVWEK